MLPFVMPAKYSRGQEALVQVLKVFIMFAVEERTEDPLK